MNAKFIHLLAVAAMVALSASSPAAMADENSYKNLSPAAIDLSADEQAVLDDVSDDGPWSRSPLTMEILLERITLLPALTLEQFNQLEQPLYTKLIKTPGNYRGQLIRMTVSVMTVMRLKPSPLLRARSDMWLISCLGAAGTKAEKELKPIIAFSFIDPAELIGPPDRVTDEGIGIYDPEQQADLAGVFFRLCDGDFTDPSLKRKLPILIVNQFSPDNTNAGKSSWKPLILPGFFVAILAVVFFFIRRRLGRRSKAEPEYEYTSLRDDDGDDDEFIDGEVDPALQLAAKRYRHERGLDE